MTLHFVLKRAGERQAAKYRSHFPPQSEVQKVSVLLAERFDSTGRIPNREDLRALLIRFDAAAKSNTLTKFSRREWSKAIWGIWDASFPLSSHETFWAELQVLLRSSNRRTLYKNLILTYLREFDESDSGVRRAAQLIREFLRLEGQRDWLWTRRHATFQLFDPTAAPSEIASLLLSSEHPVDAVLAEAGCTGVAAASGLERAAFRKSLTDMQQSASVTIRVSQINRIITWATKEGALRYPSIRAELADSLLLPWQKVLPAAEIKKEIQSFVLRHYGDPRIDRAGWHHVSEGAQQVIRRWLTKATLDQFIAVVTKVAEEGHWKYRKAFWMAYYQHDLIDDAWVLFGKEAQIFAKLADEEIKSIGYLLAGGLSNHCVLMLQIGGLTIADWSHSGACRIWKAGNKNAPALYKNYRADVLRVKADFEQAHHGSKRHTWQESIARYIRDMTGSWVPIAARTPPRR